MDSKAAKHKEKMERKNREKEEMKMWRDKLDELANDERREQLAFPSTLGKGHRKKLHTYAHSIGLKSKSHGTGDDRFLIVYKKTVTPFVPTNQNTIRLELSEESYEKIDRLLAVDPVSEVERQNTILRPMDNNKSQAHLPFMFGDFQSRTKVTVPPPNKDTAQQFTAVRHSLPIFEHRDEILTAINQHQVVVISGETGSGKTTQVPQYIMEQCTQMNRECRIICTQPRRLAATSIATRISEERNDGLGKSVGYQIRLDSRITPTTNLIFTTSGFLLRCLTGSKQDDVYKNVTHLIIDEVHEREKVTDFLLIAIRDAIKVNQRLKVILMSATLDSELFSDYFDKCPVINVPGRLFDVETLHLADVLMATGYKTKKMDIYMAENQGPKILRQNVSETVDQSAANESALAQISPDDLQFYDECFDECLDQDDSSTFEQIFCLITDENMPVNHMHRQKMRTALAIAAEKGYDEMVTRLLELGADPNFMDPHGMTAFDYAEANEHEECYEILMHHQNIVAPATNAVAAIRLDSNDEARAHALQQFTLTAYQMTGFNEIDQELLHHVILSIHLEKPTDGSILVFLPGYEDIMTQKEMIETRFQVNNYQLFVLHSGVNGTNSAEQTRVFDRMPQGIRKIILSTNIAETSLTINDVVYVVDSGKVKQLSYDSISESTCLTSTIISQACAKQRAGRAGRIRNGYCYRLYSKEQYDTMEKYTLPEILRVPLTEICLNAKMLADNLSIEEFLLRALQPPSVKNIRQSIELLKKINALDEHEHITYLGIHLANMPVDCQYGKMILYAILMRCLDPVVTIVSALSVKDPFMLPLGSEGEKINEIKKGFAQDSMSDHQMLLNTYNAWTGQRRRGEFCQENYISSGNMQMIQGVRRLIMGHLKMAELVSENSARNLKKLNLNALRWDVVKACLTAGMYPNLCRISNLNGQIFSKQDKKLLPHMASILRQRKARGQIDPNVMKVDAEWLVHGEKSRISTFSLIKNITIVPAIDVILFTGPITLPSDCISASYEQHVEGLSDMDCDDIPHEDDLLYDGHDELYAEARDAENDVTLRIDDWICFNLEHEEAQLLFQLRQKFASMLSKFLKNPVTFQMTNKEENMLQLLIEVIGMEDHVEKRIQRMVSKKLDDENDAVTSEAISEMPSEVARRAGRKSKTNSDFPVGGPAYASEAYNQAIEPANRRNKKNKKKNNKKFGFNASDVRQNHVDWRSRPPQPQPPQPVAAHETIPNPKLPNYCQTFEPKTTKQQSRAGRNQRSSGFNLPPMELCPTGWRSRDSQRPVSNQPNNQPANNFAQPPQPSTSYASAQEKFTQALFKSACDTAPTATAVAPTTSTSQNHSLNFNLPAAFDITNLIQNRYFILTVKSVPMLYASVYGNRWNFTTPLSEMRRIARETAPGKIYVMLHVNMKKRAAVFCYGQFRSVGSGHYKIDIDDNIRSFRPLYMMDLANDCELSTADGNSLYNFCLSAAIQTLY